MPTIQIQEQEGHISGKLILGAEIKPPLLGNEIHISNIRQSYANIPQLDGNVSFDTTIMTESTCNNCEDTIGSSTVLSQHTQCENGGDQTWKKLSPQGIPVITSTSFKNFEDPPPWYEEYIPRKIDKNESKMN